jgi:hypothetical protein
MLILASSTDSIPSTTLADPRRGKTCGIWYGLGMPGLGEHGRDPAHGFPVEMCVLEEGKEKL